MANNEYVNRVDYGNDTLIDISDTTAEAGDVIQGQTFYTRSGAPAVGSLGDATTSTHGLMSVEDKVKLNNINEIQIDKTIDTPADIMSFSDGADDLPMALTVGIEPVQDLHGYDRPWPAGGGKNLLDTESKSEDVNGLTVTYNYDSAGNLISVKINGTQSSGIGTIRFSTKASSNAVVLPVGNYIYSVGNTLPSGVSISVGRGSEPIGGSYVPLGNQAYDNLPFTVDYAYTLTVQMIVNAGTTLSNFMVYPMIRLATETDATYEPYSNVCPITGWTGANVMRTGVNLALIDSHAYNYSAWSIDSSTFNGQTVYTRTNSYLGLGYKTFARAGYKYTFSIYAKSTATETAKIYAIHGDVAPSAQIVGNNGTDISITTSWQRFTRTIEVTEDGYIVPRIESSNATNTIYISCYQVEIGNVASDYEQYAGTVYPIAFPSSAGTVYGGTLTVNKDGTGTLVVNKGNVDLGSLTWSLVTGKTNLFQSINLQSIVSKPSANSIIANVICAKYKTGTSNDVSDNDEIGIAITTGGTVRVFDSVYSDASTFTTAMSGVQLVYELVTPVTYTLTAPQIHTFLSQNNIWADTGNILSITYYAATPGLINIYDKIKLNNINLLGIKLNTTVLTPDTNGYVSIPLMTGATSSTAGTAGLVPAPTTSNVNHYLRGDGTWNTPVVILTYGVSTYTDFINAYNAGAIVYCRATMDTEDQTLTDYPRYAALSYVNSNPEALFVEFLYYRTTTPSSNNYGNEVFIYKLTGDGTWSTTRTYDSLRKIIVSGDGLSTSWNSNVLTLTTSAFTGATLGADGTSGLVPAPTSSDTAKFLRGDGTWAVVTGGGGSGGITGVNVVNGSLVPDANGIVTVPAMTGCSSSAAGAAGVVPAPSSGDQDKFLAGDGTWKAGGLPMVILSYGNSTWKSFIDAYTNNVIVYCRASSSSNPASGNQTRMAFMAYVNDAASPSEVEFQYYRSVSSHTSSTMGDEVYVYKLNNSGTWSVTKRDASLKEIVNNSTAISLSYSSNKITISDA